MMEAALKTIEFCQAPFAIEQSALISKPTRSPCSTRSVDGGDWVNESLMWEGDDAVNVANVVSVFSNFRPKPATAASNPRTSLSLGLPQ